MKSHLLSPAITVAGLASLSSLFSLEADVRLPSIFSDHMVLQQDGKIPVWGTAEPGEMVKVELGHSEGSSTANAQGQWRVDLPPLPANSISQSMTVTGKNSLTFQDVLIGDVWLGSGQSNMGLTMNDIKGRGPGVDDAIASPPNPQLRLFTVDNQTGIIPKSTLTGSWQIASPDSIPRFSAAAYFFGRELQRNLNRPIGLIASSWGGTYIQSWLSFESLKGLPFAADGVAGVQKKREAYPQDATAQAALQTDFQAKLKDWQTNVDAPFGIALQKWQADDAKAKAAGQAEPPRPVESASPPVSPDGEPNDYSVLFNGMISPLIPYGIKGVIWYQGENNARANANTGEPHYQELLSTMITVWRSRWSEGNFPFLIVGLANFDYRYPMPTDSGWAAVWDAQEKVAESLPNTALAEAIDLGEAHNIHPVDKLDLGKRLAAAAQHIAYGQDVPFAGPSFSGMAIEGNTVRVKFKNVGSGLTIGVSPHSFADNPPLPTDQLVGFALSGADQKWVFAQARIDGDTVIISSSQVPSPVAVRYGWATNPAVNLDNKDGFPAVPFRTDDWAFVPPPPPPASW